MKHILSYDQYLNEASTAKDIEKKLNKMGKPKDDEEQLAKDMKDTSKGPTTPPEEDAADDKKEDENLMKKSKAADSAKNMKKASDGEVEAEELEESAHEHHGSFDERLLSMTVNDVLDYLEKKDKAAYASIEKSLESAFKDMTKADESWFTTMTA